MYATNYQQIVSEIGDFFDRHLDVNTFVHIQEYDFQAKYNLYPAVILTPQPSNINGNEIVLRFNLFFFDILKQDKSNTIDVYNDCLNTAKDFVSYFSNRNPDDWSIENDAQITPFEEALDDYLGGWMLSFGVVIPFSKSVCDLPLSN